jgi:hypothetical protein
MRDPGQLENLKRLLGAIETFAAGDEICRKRQSSPDPAARSLAGSLPLGHSRGAAHLKSIAEEGGIFSRIELERRGVALTAGGNTERVLGTADDVFTYVGPLRYPGTSCGLFFKPNTELIFSSTAVATFFDSGGILKHWPPNHLANSDDAKITYLRRNEMAVPDYREYLWRCLVLLFASPWHYVDGTGPDVSGPAQVDRDDARGWTFEVRFARALPLAGTLMGVILPAWLGFSLLEAIAAWKRAGVDVKFYETPDANEANEWKSLQKESLRYLAERL